jgi:glycosyltransferase involved in cell wall biosynthesis
MIKPDVSVVIPVFNAERFIADAVDSALGQESVAVEVIVIDDGSVDGTAEIIRSFGERVTALSQSNQGPAVARNLASARAHADVVAFLDADDLWLPTRLARCLGALAAAPDLSGVTTNATIVDEDGRFQEFYYQDDWSGLRVVASQEFVTTNPLFGSMVLRRSALDDVGWFLPNCRRSEDYELWIRATVAGHRFGILSEPSAIYRLHPSSLTADVEHQSRSHFRSIGIHLPALVAGGVRGYAEVAQEAARVFDETGDRSRARRLRWLAVHDRDKTALQRIGIAAEALLRSV